MSAINLIALVISLLALILCVLSVWAQHLNKNYPSRKHFLWRDRA